jgi:RHS repeat-associated protein
VAYVYDVAHKFTAKERDPESNLDNFGARYFSSQMGRFMSADPSGVAFSNPANPQSWNLYSYVQNNPLSAVDPDGRQCVWDDGSYDSADDPNTGSVGQCTAAGGTYFDPSTFHENASLQGSNDDWSASPNSFLAGQVADVQALQDSPPTMPGADQATWWNTFTSGMTTTINCICLASRHFPS